MNMEELPPSQAYKRLKRQAKSRTTRRILYRILKAWCIPGFLNGKRGIIGSYSQTTADFAGGGEASENLRESWKRSSLRHKGWGRDTLKGPQQWYCHHWRREISWFFSLPLSPGSAVAVELGPSESAKHHLTPLLKPFIFHFLDRELCPQGSWRESLLSSSHQNPVLSHGQIFFNTKGIKYWVEFL